MEAVIIRFVDLPPNVHGVTVVDPDGDYNVYINAKQGFNDNEKAKMHELKHIESNDFYNIEDIRVIEAKEATL